MGLMEGNGKKLSTARHLKYYRPKKSPNPRTQRFIFATGIECSYPVISTKSGPKRMDEMEKCHHYKFWKQDLELTVELGISYLRYGPPYYKMHLGPGRYDWSWTDLVFPEMRKLQIVPIVDLCHFGVPDWIGNFQNPDFPKLFAEFAEAFAQRYPWVRFYTPINEMYIAAEFSGFYGWWNEGLKSHKYFVTALKHLVKANIEAMLSILKVRADALFIQSESSEYTHAAAPDLIDEAEMLNERRFLSLDLNYGHRVSSGMYEYLMDHGMKPKEYDYFLQHNLLEHCIMGNDYYVTNEHLLIEENKRVFAGGEVFGYYVITEEYYKRYNLPVMHTETNLWEPGSEHWLWRTWANIQRLRHDGVPVCGMTWYSLTDQVDWDNALRADKGHVNPMGLYDLDRKIRPVGLAYKKLIKEWSHIPLLPNGPLTLVGEWDLLKNQPQDCKISEVELREDLQNAI
jgi:beta-glucosidase/6-phospho-beta-glucosidase/beta-galactosidase